MNLTPEQEAKVRALKIDDLTARYIGIRDRKHAVVEQNKSAIATFDAELDRLENIMLCWLQLYGLQSAPTPNGTPYLTDKTGATIKDRAAFDRFVLEDPANRMAFFTNAIGKDTVRQYMEVNEGVPPPGVDWYSEKAVNFKR